ncbi:MAG: long-chain fatty acid--CoA ligase [Planctomycetes bacterium]|mgnify:CR=1 FL=1|nr:long-chain fatty acid--CoA ligase [Planctomycetota bacterium]MCB9910306.1 long-chain fatty acid--CoA ligase [Planctomycetota bacterium]HPF13092.1 long-chain fatty acid--CoA ligase [Planctomycetota bacterium]HRV80130.1 long-chain fatty acid--CoA ligase [Planctomycetota bacterium]
MQDKPWFQHYPEFTPRSIDYEAITLPAMLERSCAKYPSRVALQFLMTHLDYAKVGEEVRRLACALDGLGVRPGQRVAIQLPNLPQTVIAFYAALSLGAIVVMTNPLYTLREVQHQWKDADVQVAITADFVWDQLLREHRHELNPKQYILASIPDYFPFPISWLAKWKLKHAKPATWAKVRPSDTVHLYKPLLAKSNGQPPRPTIGMDDVALLQYTGGTTGVSKGATLTHRNLSCNIQQMEAWFTGLENGDKVMMTALPLFHVFGLTVCMGLSVQVGMTQVLVPNPRDMKTLAAQLAKHRVNLFPAVPAMFNALIHLKGIEGYDLTSLTDCFSGSAPISDSVLKDFEARTGARIIEGFGMSETSPVASANPVQGLRKIGSVGIPLPDTNIRIVDMEDGLTDMPLGVEGELIVKGPQVMRGYWQRDDETAHSLRDGYMYTGDLATMDEDGFLRIVGRKKDMINCSGMKVYPDEVDGVLMAHPKILEAATIGVADAKRGEAVKSFVVLRPGETMTSEEVIEYCRENLARYKVPQHVRFLDELPKSSVLKTLRRELRAMEEKQSIDD